VISSQDWHPADHGSFAAAHPGSSPGDVVELGGVSQVLWPDHCVRGTPGASFHSSLDVAWICRVIRKGADPDMLACGWARWLYFRNNTDVERSLSARPAGASPQQTAATLTAIVGRSLPYARTDTGARYGIRAKCDRRAGNLLVLLQVHRGGLDGPLVREVRASELRIWPGGKPFPARIVERSMDALGRCRMTEEYTVRKAWFGKAAGMASAVPSIESAIQVSDRRLAEPFSYAVSSTWLTRSEAAARYERVLRDRTEAHRRRATRRLVSPVFAMGSIMVIVAGGVILWKRQRGVTKPGA